MAAVSREGDSLSTGHACVGTTTLDTPGQSTVFANNILVARITDPTVAHAFPPTPACAPHVAAVAGSSSSVYIAGKLCARIGDAADAGALTSGSGTVFSG